MGKRVTDSSIFEALQKVGSLRSGEDGEESGLRGIVGDPSCGDFPQDQKLIFTVRSTHMLQHLSLPPNVVDYLDTKR